MPTLTQDQAKRVLQEARDEIRRAQNSESRPVVVVVQRSGPGHYTVRVDRPTPDVVPAGASSTTQR